MVAEPAAPWPGRLRQLADSDLVYGFMHAPIAIVSAAVAAAIVLGAAFAPWVAPHDPFDLSTISLLDAFDPPVWLTGGSPDYPLGTDGQGRDMLSAILFGARISLLVGLAAVGLALCIGVMLGLIAGWTGGLLEAAIMRLADVQLSFPTILIALLIDGIARGALSHAAQDAIAVPVLVLSIGLSGWVQFARTVRG